MWANSHSRPQTIEPRYYFIGGCQERLFRGLNSIEEGNSSCKVEQSTPLSGGCVELVSPPLILGPSFQRPSQVHRFDAPCNERPHTVNRRPTGASHVASGIISMCVSSCRVFVCVNGCVSASVSESMTGNICTEQLKLYRSLQHLKKMCSVESSVCACAWTRSGDIVWSCLFVERNVYTFSTAHVSC